MGRVRSQTSNPRSFDEDGWAAYLLMNLMYANTVAPHLHVNEMVWIHVYHLMVVPTFISRRHSTANIGFYPRTPSPAVVISSVHYEFGSLLGLLFGNNFPIV